MDCQTISFSKLPQQSRLFVRFVEDFPRVKKFYAHAPVFSAVQRVARKLRFPEERRRETTEVLRQQNRKLGASAETLANVGRLEQGAAAVVTGQQVGLFGGPAYSIYKALMAIKAARELTSSGAPAVPVFWLATEDHDFAEVNHCDWPSSRALLRLELESPEADGRPVGNMRLGEGIAALVDRAATVLEGAGAAKVETLLRECYRAEETFGSAFGQLLARVFGEHGLILLDPADERFHRMASDIYRRALVEQESLTRELLMRNRELEQAGYHAQVKVSEQSTLLFLLQEGKRVPVRARNGKFSAGGESLEEIELLERLAAEPARFSPNALLRPVVQDTLLPTACSVVGPAEVAYYAQSSVLYRHFQKGMPAIMPRASFTFVERPVQKLLGRYGFRVEDVWTGRQSLRRRMEAQALPGSVARSFDQSAAELARLLGRLETSVGKLDKTLGGAAETARRKMTYQLEKLRRKAGRASDLRQGVLDEHERQLFDALFPEHAPQERSLCFLPLLARHGQALLNELMKRTSLKVKARHQALFLD